MRWHYLDPPLVWLFPASYAIHIAEEYWARFPQWINTAYSLSLSETTFLSANGIGFVLSVVGVYLSTGRPRFGWIAIALAAGVLLNTVLHLAASIMTGSYSPGLITGVVLWVPIGLLTLMRAAYQAPRIQLWAGIAAGMTTQVVALVVLRVG